MNREYADKVDELHKIHKEYVENTQTILREKVKKKKKC